MPRPKNIETIVDAAMAGIDEVLFSLEELSQKSSSEIPQEELQVVVQYAEIIKEKLPKLQTLFETFLSGRQFIAIHKDGTVDKLDADETRRAIMQYLQRGDDIINVTRQINTRLQPEAQKLYQQFVTTGNIDGN